MMRAFVRIRPGGEDDSAVRSDDPEVDELVALALEPLPPDRGEGTWGVGDEAFIFGIDQPPLTAASGRFRLRVLP